MSISVIICLTMALVGGHPSVDRHLGQVLASFKNKMFASFVPPDLPYFTRLKISPRITLGRGTRQKKKKKILKEFRCITSWTCRQGQRVLPCVGGESTLFLFIKKCSYRQDSCGYKPRPNPSVAITLTINRITSHSK